MALPVRSGQAGRASLSARLGAADPRHRRNAQQNTNDRDVGAGLRLDKNGKLEVVVSLPLQVRNGRVEVDADALVSAIGTALEAPLRLRSGKLTVEPAGRVDTPVVAPTLANLQAKLYELVEALKRAELMEG